jgi:predicted acylesterase/phospholipase RssA
MEFPEIQHLVFAGGGPVLLQMVGALQYLSEKNPTPFLDRQKIQSMYGTSAGAIAATLVCLDLDWEIILDYLVKRPWETVFHFQIEHLFSAYYRRGIFDREVIEKIFHPLLKAKDLDPEITLQEFFLFTKIDLHIFTFEINSFQTENVSHSNYPDIPLVDALYMSCAIPVFMAPKLIEQKCFMDGGLCANYPISFCAESVGSLEHILGFKSCCSEEKNELTEDSSLMDFLVCLFFKIIRRFTSVESSSASIISAQLPQELQFQVRMLSFDYLYMYFSSTENRQQYVDKGKEIAVQFLAKWGKSP